MTGLTRLSPGAAPVFTPVNPCVFQLQKWANREFTGNPHRGRDLKTGEDAEGAKDALGDVGRTPQASAGIGARCVMQVSQTNAPPCTRYHTPRIVLA